ncbi:hypothetical protein MTZ49_09705 [Entomomonas sp. E2T0]|uniref:hypothetical protein n=1 Tax=Entomomonas sp. E2T0 TaxID=2930213 RepID=UPI0022284352|nr:hypothetical protein [Entomomonas sp. E2T0]UYZ82887.1 hypothetical protein MTZ49_09705 [Entomomonas sp. E2T0]
MTIYTISAHIKTNTASENLYYDMELYKTDWSGNETYALRPTGKRPLQADYKTQSHPSLEISDPPETCYILSINLYRKVGVDYIKMNQDPMTAIMPLKGFQTTDKEWGASREFGYFETAQDTKKAEEGQVNTYKLNISSKPRIFEAKEHPIGDPLDPFTKEKVEAELKIRMTRPVPPELIIDYTLPKTDPKNQAILKSQQERNRVKFYPWQDRSMLCGAASFFYCLQKDRPDIYQQVIKELWETGETKIGSLKIKPSKGAKHPDNFFRDTGMARVPAIDWISLASLVDTDTTFSIDKPTGPMVNISSITLAETIEKWFHKIGCRTLFDNISYSWHSNLADVCQLNHYIKPDSQHLITLISGAMLKGGVTFLGMSAKSHWITWNDKLRVKRAKLTDPLGAEVTTTTSLSTLVELEMFSWGNVKQYLKDDITLGEFLKHTYGGMVFTKIP